MYAHVPGRIHRRGVSQMSARSRDHHLFLRHISTPWELLKSAVRWVEEAQGDEDLLSTLNR